LTTCFQGIINVGADHWSSCDGNVAAPTLDTVTQQAAQDEGAALDREGATQHATEGDEVEEVTPSPGSCKRARKHVEDTRKKVKTTNAILIQEACPSMASLANAYAAKKDGNSLLMKS
jgi:hypothetical protein